MASSTTTIKVVADTRDAERSLSGLQSTLLNLAGIGSISALAKQFVDLTSAMQEMTNKLISVSTGITDANAKFEVLASTAQKTGSNLGGTVDLYQKLAQSSTFAGSSTASLAKVAENFNKTLQISGASGAGAASALYQFAQAMQKGTLNGDEFRTMSETNGFMLKVLQQELGKSSTELRQMASEGRLSAEVIAKALLNSNMVAENYGKTIRTIPQAFENLNTSISVIIKRFNDFTGVGNGLATVIDTIAGSIPAMIGGIVGLGAAMLVLAVRITAVRTAIIAMRAAMISTGLGALIVAAGVAAGYLADKMGLFGDQAKDAVKPLEDQNEKLQEGLVITHQRNEQALNLDKTLKEQVGSMQALTAIEMKSTGIKSLQLEGEKALAAEVEKYKKTGEAIDAGLAAQLVKATQNKILAEERNNVQKQLLDLQSQTVTLGILDAQEAKIRTDLEKFRLSVTKETYNARKAEVEQALRAEFSANARNTIEQQLITNARESNILYAQGAIAQEQLRAIEQIRRQFGQQIADQYKDQVASSTARLVIDRELSKILYDQQSSSLSLGIYTENLLGYNTDQLDILLKQQEVYRQLGVNINDISLKDRVRISDAIRLNEENKKNLEYYKQIRTSIESVNVASTGAKAGAGAAGQMGQLDAVTAAQTANQTLFNGLQFLRSNDLINEQQYQNAKLAATVQGQEAMYNATKKRFEDEALLRIQAQTGSQFGYDTQKAMAQEAANFDKKSTMEKNAFAIDQAAQMFTALGAHNKSAFEAAKAFNIANAVMNTYMAATKALATYPPPFSFIAAAAAVGMGLAQVAAIRSQTYSGRALGGPVKANTPYMVGERGPELFTPSNSGNITRNDQLGGSAPVNVNFNIQAVDATSFDLLLVNRRGLITQIISDAMMEKGQRGI